MTPRWGVRAANDRAPQRENRIPPSPPALAGDLDATAINPVTEAVSGFFAPKNAMKIRTRPTNAIKLQVGARNLVTL